MSESEQRVKRYRDKQLQAGRRPYQHWLTPEAQKALKKLAGREPTGNAIEQLLANAGLYKPAATVSGNA